MILPLSSVSRPALGPTQPPVQWVPGVLSPGLKRGRAVTLTTHPIKCRGREWIGAIPPLPPSASMACSGTALPLCISYRRHGYAENIQEDVELCQMLPIQRGTE
jgi:hypothetical protein